MKRPKQSVIDAELESLRKKHRGRLKPSMVVAAATPKSSVLHLCFTWDDSKAAHAFRLEQARDLIQCSCIMVPNESGGETKVNRYVSLKKDRAEKTGYRAMEDVLSNASLRATLLREALEDLKVWELRNRRLNELKPIRVAAERVRRKAA